MKWEYLRLTLIGQYHYSEHTAVMDAYGQEKWELVAVDAGVTYFKRPLEDQAEEGTPIYTPKDTPLTHAEYNFPRAKE